MGEDFGGLVCVGSIGYGDCAKVGNPQMSPVRMSMKTLPSTCDEPSGLRIVV